MDWFRHDSDARNDIKLRRLTREVGIGGIGAFWVVIEILFTKGGEASVEEVMDELDFLEASDMLEALEKHNLIKISDGIITSDRVHKEICFQEEAKQKRSEAGRKAVNARWNKTKQSHTNEYERIQSNTNEYESVRIIPPNHTIPNHTNNNKLISNNKTKIKEANISMMAESPVASNAPDSQKESEANTSNDAYDANIAITIISNTKEEVPIHQDMVDLWQKTYPGVDVMAELRKMKSWSISNPTSRKTRSGMLRFADNWLKKEQNNIKVHHQSEYIKGTNIKMPITADGSDRNKYKNQPTLEELYRRSI